MKMSSTFLLSKCYTKVAARFIQQFQSIQVRRLNLLEYQSKNLLQQSGVSIQNFCVVEGRKDANILENFNVQEYVVKAQILAGGRGKGHFSNGFIGGVHVTKNRQEMLDLVDRMVGHKLITKQTPENGILVKKVMVARSVNIIRETYLCILLDRDHNGPVLIASPAGGMDIEVVAEKTPELIKTVPIDINVGLSEHQCIEISEFLGFKNKLIIQAANEIQKLWQLFLKVDAVQIEINPLAETDAGEVISVDAKLNFDDNAAYRQTEIFNMNDSSESDPREVEAAKYNLNYVAMDGDIGCLVNGAGLAMATMDIIKLHGRSPANFLDCGGGVREEHVLKAFQILVNDKKVKGILVNVFGGIVNCETIAHGIINAAKIINLSVPLVVRLQGTNVAAATQMLAESELPLKLARDLEEAAKLIVQSIK